MRTKLAALITASAAARASLDRQRSGHFNPRSVTPRQSLKINNGCGRASRCQLLRKTVTATLPATFGLGEKP